jgi:DNA invertase Pin-like site-specific DNA recombinase
MQNNGDEPQNPFEKEREFVEMVAAIRAKVAEIERERLAARRQAGRSQKRNAAREHVDKAGQ